MNDVMQTPISVDLGDGTVPIVMVDDEQLDFQLVKLFHKRSCLSNPLLHFFNGAEFLAYLESSKEGAVPLPAVVLMDINMPNMNGFEVIEKIRCDEHFMSTPFIMMLTSSDDPRDRERADTAGANGYLVKPFNPNFYLDFFNSLVNKN